ncbi:hypothetical protein COW83_02030, partial [Candidatus Collierbacteria bacterium CG22_combo_CG10-13_8_21_14_all_43_12]
TTGRPFNPAAKKVDTESVFRIGRVGVAIEGFLFGKKVGDKNQIRTLFLFGPSADFAFVIRG